MLYLAFYNYNDIFHDFFAQEPQNAVLPNGNWTHEGNRDTSEAAEEKQEKHPPLYLPISFRLPPGQPLAKPTWTPRVLEA